MTGRLVAVVIAGALVASAVPLLDPRLRPGDDWLHAQWVYLFALPFSLLLGLAWLLDRRAA